MYTVSGRDRVRFLQTERVHQLMAEEHHPLHQKEKKEKRSKAKAEALAALQLDNLDQPKTITVKFHPSQPHLLLVLCVTKVEEYFVACYDLGNNVLAATPTSAPSTPSLVAGR